MRAAVRAVDAIAGIRTFATRRPLDENRHMLVGYFDESGHLGEGGFMSLAGFVATDEHWQTFDAAWNTALARHGVPYLHTTDLANFKRLYKGWSEEQRRQLVADLVDVIHATGRVVAVGSVLAIDDFNSFPEDARERMRNPFFTLFQQTVNGASLEAMFSGPEAQVRMVHSQQGEFQGATKELFAVMKKVNRRLGDLQFADMRTTPGLQAADLLAYELKRFYKNMVLRPDVPLRWPMRQILLQQHALGIHFLRYLPRWYIRLQLAPRWVFMSVSTAIAVLVAIPAYFNLTVFGWANRAPMLSKEDRRLLRELERRAAQERVR